MKMAAFWDIEPCSLIEVERRFRGAHCLLHQGDDISSTELNHIPLRGNIRNSVKITCLTATHVSSSIHDAAYSLAERDTATVV
jgi:hypothetical protein